MQQYKLAKYCEDIFEDYLLRRPLDASPVRTQLADVFSSANFSGSSAFYCSFYWSFRSVIYLLTFAPQNRRTVNSTIHCTSGNSKAETLTFENNKTTKLINTNRSNNEN